MPKRTAAFDLLLPPRDTRSSAGRWLYASLRAEILDGRLRPGARLPATRDLARQYGLSRGTIVNAFEELRSEGYLEGSQGSGTYVSRVLPEQLLQAPRATNRRSQVQARQRRRLSNYGRRVELFPNLENRPTRAFRANLPALELFPTKLWTKLANRRLQRLSTSLLLGCGPLGYQPLREGIADYLNISRGVNCIPEQVVIVSGTQESLDLAARLFLNPGDRVCMEDPGYPGAAMAFESVGARVRGLPLDSEGMRFERGALQDAKLVYITPGHQFPLGMTMSLARRLQLLEWARHAGALIFEDDYDSEFRYSGRPMPALQGLDRYSVVLFSGSFSKVLFPALRLGYLVLPLDLVDRVAAIKSLTTRHAPPFDQAVLCDFMTGGHFSRHLRRMREIYAERLSTLIESSRERLAGLLEISVVEAGLQTTGWLGGGIDAKLASRAAAARRVEVISLDVYSRVPMVRAGLQLGFAALEVSEIRRGVQQLAAALEAELATRRRRRANAGIAGQMK